MTTRRPSLVGAVAKRGFDLVVAVLLLIVLSPVLITIAALIRIRDGSPVLFRQERVGRNSVPFRVLKFRTMRSTDAPGAQVTIQGDTRITGVGRRLRAHRLDELPQLINVLKGDMSLVGPRPELARYVSLFPEEYRQILALRPGITGPASVEFRNESELLAAYPDPERAYVEVILPQKIALALDYLRERSMLVDVKILGRTVRAFWG
jgi:lipopolysaccharide/colanic/teichoic acid biosynthesis glycosyltransferase